MAKLKIKIDLEEFQRDSQNEEIFEIMSVILAYILNNVEIYKSFDKNELFIKVRKLTEAMEGLRSLDRTTLETIAAKQNELNLKKFFKDCIKEFNTLTGMKIKVIFTGNKNQKNKNFLKKIFEIIEVSKLKVDTRLKEIE